MYNKNALLQAIAKEETSLSRLDSEREQVIARLNVLKQQLADLETAHSDSLLTCTQKTPREKVALFHSLFRGREDIFPKLWTSRAGKKGYSPACTNDWASGICGKTRKPRVKCSGCDNRKFLPVTDQVIMDHLQGRHVIGVYPMLPDDTCGFLAADFDKETWKEDVAEFRLEMFFTLRHLSGRKDDYAKVYE